MRLITLATIILLAGGGCAHEQRPEPRIHVISADARGLGTSLGTGGSGLRNCDEEHVKFFDECWNSDPLPWPHTKRDGWFHEYCTKECRKQSIECEKANEKAREERQLKFSRIDEAIDWLKNHKDEVALGMVVVIGGVSFVIAIGGGGALILAPLAV